ncbi:MAG: hypothetical protein WCD79_01975 [Chthoniobacteraceae bacterium]
MPFEQIISLTVNGLTLLFFIWRLGGQKERREIYPQPLEVKAAAEYATKAELNLIRMEFTSQIEGLRKEWRHDIGKLMESGEIRAGKLHTRIDAVLTAVSRLEGRIES